MAKENIPRHVAIIMDGNGRWAKERGLPRIAGHRQGTKRVKEIVRTAKELGIKVLTLFAFSSENWSRPKKEIDTLLRYFNDYLDKEINNLHKNNIRFKVIGRKHPLPQNLLEKIKESEIKTENNDGMVLVLALNYGSRQEITDAAKKIADALLRKELNLDDLDENTFSRYLYTQGLPDPDLLIRTSGEVRISNFLLWQASYAELYFPKTYWPDFKKEDLILAIKEYNKRQRRYGQIKAGEA
jgi:undecaprenyl diphosphate synthase